MRSASSSSIVRGGLTHGIFALSGFAGLGYQMIWARQLAVGLGHEMPGVLAVVTAFFGGLAIGAWSLDRPVSRSEHPERWYAVLECIIAGWALLMIPLLPALNGVLADLIGIDPPVWRHWLVALCVPLIALLPATAAMGATLPAMERYVFRLHAGGRRVAGLYAANTLGAAGGVLASTFWLVPALGFQFTLGILLTINVVCAAAILLLPFAATATFTVRHVAATFLDAPSPARLDLTLLLTGALGIGYEVLGVRVMAQVLQNTVYSYASALVMYLLFTAIGAAIYHRFAQQARFKSVLTGLLHSLAISCLAGIFVLHNAAAIESGLTRMLGGGATAALLGEMLLAAFVFALPTLLMGATFSHLAQAARHEHGGVGRALGINTIGGMLAPLTFGVVLLPMTGAKFALVVVALGYLILLPSAKPIALVPTAVPAILLLLLPPHLVLVRPAPGGEVVEYREGVMAAVAVVTDAEGNRFLKVNNRFHMGGTTNGFLERRLAHLPLLLHPEPQRALFLGIGTGITMGAADIHEGLAREGVELLPEVIELLEAFESENDHLTRQRDVTIHAADARRFMRATVDRYDVIVADLYHPARDGSGSLYTVEHFEAIRAQLTDNGLFCQWLPLYQLDEEMVRLITRTFLRVFPSATAWIAHYNVNTPCLGLIGSRQALTYPMEWFERRVAGLPVLRGLIDQRQALYDPFALFGCFVAGRSELESYAGRGSVNTDDRSIVTFRAPRFVYQEHRVPPYGRLVDLLEHSTSDAGMLFEEEDPHAAEFVGQLRDYIAARDVYLDAEIMRMHGRFADAAQAYVRSAEMSDAFSAGYVMAVRYAQQIVSAQPEDARALLRMLREAQPHRAEAPNILRATFGE